MFGEHSKCNPDFCKQANATSTGTIELPPDSDSEDNVTHIDNDPELTGFSELIDSIIESEKSDELTRDDEADAQIGLSESTLQILPEGLFAKVVACVDHLVMLACFDGGKQYNRIQKGSFEHRCYAAGLRVQNGRTWPLDF